MGGGSFAAIVLLVLLIAQAGASQGAAAPPTKAAAAGAAPAAPPGGSDGGSSHAQQLFEYLKTHGHSSFAQMLAAVGANASALPPRAVATLLAPSDAAVERFLRSMNLTLKELLDRPQLVDAITSYHLLPGAAYGSRQPPPGKPVVARTADTNYVVRLYQPNGGGAAALVQDAQGRNYSLGRPATFGNVSVVPIDGVLASGGFFATPSEALRYYPGWRPMRELVARAGWPALDAPGGDVTLFVPDANALQGLPRDKAIGSVSQGAASDLVKAHAVQPAQQIGGGGGSSRWASAGAGAGNGSAAAAAVLLPTLLPGRELQATVVDRAALAPERWGRNATAGHQPRRVTVAPVAAAKAAQLPSAAAAPAAANVTTFNIFVGRGVFHGVDGLLASADALPASAPAQQGAPKAAATAAAVAAQPAKPAAALPSASARRPLALRMRAAARRLLQMAAAYAGDGGSFAEADPEGGWGPWGGYYGGYGGGDPGWYQDNPATSFAAANTVGALQAGARGPGTYWNGYVNGPCWNCDGWESNG